MLDPTFAMPTENWQPTSSYNAQMPPPTVDPDADPLVQLPCVNQAWVPWILGALDQLRIPLAYLVPDDTTRELQLQRVDLLRSMMSGTVNVPCCNVQMRLTSSCELQFSVDGGTTWNTVSGWDANLNGCIQANVPAHVPGNPQALSTPAEACAIATYLATQIIQAGIAQGVSSYNANQSALQFGQTLIASIAYAFPITALAFEAFTELYALYTGATISEFTSASTDVTLLDDVICAIYGAIESQGYVTSSNFAAVHTALAAISYTYPLVVSAIAAYWNALGLGNVQAMQSVATSGSGTCSTCGGWCYQFDFTAGMQGWTVYSSSPGSYVGGVGFQDGPISGVRDITIQLVFPHALTITKANITFIAPQGSGGLTRDYHFFSGGSPVLDVAIDAAAHTSPAHSSTGAISVTADELFVRIQSQPGGTATIVNVQLQGNGADPFGVDNCTY